MVSVGEHFLVLSLGFEDIFGKKASTAILEKELRENYSLGEVLEALGTPHVLVGLHAL